MTEDIVARVAQAVVMTYYNHTESMTEADKVVCPTDIKAAKAALAAIRETHAIVPKDRIDSEALAELIAMDADLLR